MIFRKVGIALTDRCTASCAMCCFRCNPGNKQVLSRDTVFDIIRQAEDIPEITSVGLSGGEAMLYPGLVLDSVREIKRANMRASLTSNGFWASDEKAAADTLRALKDAGLDSLSVSVDAYHIEYVPLDRIRHILRLCRTVNLPLSLAVGDTLKGTRAADIIKALDRDIYNTQVTVYPFYPIGAGQDLANEAFAATSFSDDWKCPFQGDLLVFADGTVYPCCSQAVYQSHLSNGSIYTDSLRELMDSYERYCLFAGLRRIGFGRLMQIAKQAGMELPDAFVSPCHLCNVLFSSADFCRAVRPHMEKEYAAVVRAALGLAAECVK